MIELDRHADIDVTVLAAAGVPDALADHADVLVTVAPDSKEFRDFVKANHSYLYGFMARGGRIVAAGSGIKAFEKHPNLVGVPAGKSLVDAVLKSR